MCENLGLKNGYFLLDLVCGYGRYVIVLVKCEIKVMVWDFN